MNKLTVPAFTIIAALVLMGASKCNLGGEPSNETCSITARDTENIHMRCTDEKGNVREDITRAPSDLYPLCQVNTYWPGCKQK